MKTKISVITVVKNGMPFLPEAFDSYKNQSYRNKELIVVYSQSKDETKKIINKNKKFIKKLIKDNKSKNKFTPLNLGIKKASGDIIGILHSDDLYPNRKVVEKVVKVFKKTNADVIYGNALFCLPYDKEKIVRKWKSNNFKKKIYNLDGCHLIQLFMLKKKF